MQTALLQLDQSQQAANILFDRGVLGVVVFALFGVLAWVYREGRLMDREHRTELKELVIAYQKQNADMIKVVEQHSTTLQSLISSLQVNEAIQELVKDSLRETKQDIIQTIKDIGHEKN